MLLPTSIVLGMLFDRFIYKPIVAEESDLSASSISSLATPFKCLLQHNTIQNYNAISEWIILLKQEEGQLQPR